MNKGNTQNQLVMKTTMKLLLVLLVVVGAVTLTSCKKLPDQVIISGIVTDQEEQPVEDVRVCVTSVAPYSGFGFIGEWFTDKRGCYEVEFEPYRSSTPYTIHFDITKDDGKYSYSCEVDVYQAVHEINVVLLKKEE